MSSRPKKRKGKTNNKSGWKKAALAGAAVFLFGVAFLFFKVFGPNTDGFRKGAFFYIPSGATYSQVLTALEKEGFVRDIRSFDFLARRANYPAHVHAGKYRIGKGMSNYNIIRMLRSGRQTPVKLVINKLRTKTDFIRFVCQNLEADSVVMAQMLNDNVYLSQFGLDSNTALCAVVPDTYEFWWNTSAGKAFTKFAGYYKQFWTEERKSKAKALGLKITEVVALASIVEEETNNNPEKPKIASVYLNRLKLGMKLQADPTARFAANNFALKRITSAITSIPSPYNTYFSTGLPPGPICTPSKKSVDAVLNAPRTDYLYFCAREDFSGTHRFASTYTEHQKNAALYQRALNQRGIH